MTVIKYFMFYFLGEVGRYYRDMISTVSFNHFLSVPQCIFFTFSHEQLTAIQEYH